MTQTLTVNTHDELSEIADNVNALLMHIKKIMLNIKDNSVSLNRSSELVANKISDASQNIREVSATMEKMSTFMDKTGLTLGQINESVDSTNDIVREIHRQSGEGSILSRSIMQKAKNIRDDAVKGQEESQKVRNDVSVSLQNRIEKAKSVTRINQLTEEIISITDETNLLAINASIEAARFGEQGKGFAVVAGEIKNLANNSAAAALQISQVSKEIIDEVEELANESEKIIGFMEETSKESFDNTLSICDDYQNDAKAMLDMAQVIEEKSEHIQEVMEAVKESIGIIHSAIDESTVGVATVSDKTTDITASVAEIETEANTNNTISSSLNEEVNKFKLE